MRATDEIIRAPARRHQRRKEFLCSLFQQLRCILFPALSSPLQSHRSSHSSLALPLLQTPRSRILALSLPVPFSLSAPPPRASSVPPLSNPRLGRGFGALRESRSALRLLLGRSLPLPSTTPSPAKGGTTRGGVGGGYLRSADKARCFFLGRGFVAFALSARSLSLRRTRPHGHHR